MLTITEIVSMTTKKAKVFTDGRPSLILYSGELKKLGWEEGSQITEEQYERVLNDTVIKRAKLYAMHLLQDQDRTEKELTDKIRRAGYDPEIAQAALDYVKRFGYVDDERYAENYISRNSGVKSRRQIRKDLAKKGIDSDALESLLDDNADEHDEHRAVARLLKKRHYSPNVRDWDEKAQKERDKQLRYLASKGFTYAAVRYVFDHWDEFE